MSFELSLHGPFNRQAWRDEIRTDLWNEGQGYLLNITGAYNGFDRSEDAFAREQLWLLPFGGIRGVTVTQEPDRITLTLPAGCSDIDFAMAWTLLRMGIENGAEAVDEEGKVLNGSEDEQSEYTRYVQGYQWNSLKQQARTEGGVALPVGGIFNLAIYADDFSQGTEALRNALADRMMHYGQAHVATLMDVEDDFGQPHKLANFPQSATLVSKNAEYILMDGPHGHLLNEPVHVSQFYGALNGRVHDLGRHYFVPSIDFNAEPELLEAIRGNGPVPEHDDAHEMDAECWATLGKAVVAVFVLIATADGQVDDKEVRSFANLLESGELTPSVTFTKAVRIAHANLSGFLIELNAPGADFMEALANAKAILDSDRLPREQGRLFRIGLNVLAESVAQSARGGMFGLGHKVSRKEQEVINMIAQIFPGV